MVMRLAMIDWFVIAAYCAASVGIGVWFSKRAGENTGEYFLAGRKLTWWMAGTSMVATTFAADTPLAVSGFVRKGGIYENWFWWSALMGGMLCVFFYARLWRRARIVTDVEFIELRYKGPSAAALRAFMAIYGGVISNCIVMGWVMLAITKIATTALGWPEEIPVTLGSTSVVLPGKAVLLAALIVVTLFYTMMSGLWGVVMTDLVQFVVAMIGAIALAVLVIMRLGGPEEMVRQVLASPGVDPKIISFVPDLATAGKLAVFTFVVYVTVQWWGGGQGSGYIAQRMFATKDERHASLAMLWFNYAHYVIRSWPWIIVGLASVVYFPLVKGEDPELAYPKMMVEFLPAGLRGLMIVSFLAAFMSTIDTQLNYGASYFINDIYRRFIRRDADEKHYVSASRYAVLGLMILGGITAWQMTSISGAWKYLAKLSAGAGFVGLLRWYWWRVNPWSEISALVVSLILANVLPLIKPLDQGDMYPVQLVIIIVVATAVWVAVTFMTKPVEERHLEEFYRRVRPGGWWGPMAQKCPDVKQDKALPGWPGWIAGVVCIYTGLFGIGYLCLGRTLAGAAILALSFASGWFMLSQASKISPTPQDGPADNP
ncbi:MAG TPA: Na+:solute symporter [Candidatus Brocadiia bacterium]|nr:Na+:solute symporter [Candidatus Brocadiia bacterium]